VSTDLAILFVSVACIANSAAIVVLVRWLQRIERRKQSFTVDTNSGPGIVEIRQVQ
jgi:hypothetical protein